MVELFKFIILKTVYNNAEGKDKNMLNKSCLCSCYGIK